MQVDAQRVHHSHLVRRRRTHHVRQQRQAGLVDGHPRSSAVEVTLHAQPAPLIHLVSHILRRQLRLQAQAVTAHVHAVGRVGGVGVGAGQGEERAGVGLWVDGVEEVGEVRGGEREGIGFVVVL